MPNSLNSMLPVLLLLRGSLGANSSQALPFILVASMSRTPMMAMVIAAALLRAQAKPTPPAPPAVVIQAIPPGGGLGHLPAGVFGDPADLVGQFGMLSFHGLDKEKAEQLAILLGLNFEFEGDGNIVTRQQPGIGKPRRADNLLKLTFGDSRG